MTEAATPKGWARGGVGTYETVEVEGDGGQWGGHHALSRGDEARSIRYIVHVTGRRPDSGLRMCQGNVVMGAGL